VKQELSSFFHEEYSSHRMAYDFYTIVLTDRRRMLADAGFARDDLRIWAHPDGRAIGEGVAAALSDESFLRFLDVEAAPVNESTERQREAERQGDKGTGGVRDKEI
jgi:hypothetical protein